MPIKNTNRTISFRLPAALHDEAVRLAKASGITKHQLARTLTVRALESNERLETDTDRAGVEEAFLGLLESLADLRLAMGRGVGAILQDVTPTRDKDEIRRWVLDRIIKPSARPDGEEGDPP